MYLRAVLCFPKVEARVVVQEHGVAEKFRNQFFDLHTYIWSMTQIASVHRSHPRVSQRQDTNLRE